MVGYDIPPIGIEFQYIQCETLVTLFNTIIKTCQTMVRNALDDSKITGYIVELILSII